VTDTVEEELAYTMEQLALAPRVMRQRVEEPLDLAGALMAKGDRDSAVDQLFESIGRDREWDEGAARKRLLQILEAVGLEDPWAGAQRRRLSAILFS